MKYKENYADVCHHLRNSAIELHYNIRKLRRRLGEKGVVEVELCNLSLIAERITSSSENILREWKKAIEELDYLIELEREYRSGRGGGVDDRQSMAGDSE